MLKEQLIPAKRFILCSEDRWTVRTHLDKPLNVVIVLCHDRQRQDDQVRAVQAAVLPGDHQTMLEIVFPSHFQPCHSGMVLAGFVVVAICCRVPPHLAHALQLSSPPTPSHGSCVSQSG